MKKTIVVGLITIACLGSCEQDEVFLQSQYECREAVYNDEPNPSEEIYQDLLAETVSKGVPGMMLTVASNNTGFWSGAAGYADLASQVRLEPCHITRVGSTVKTFTAATILLLYEEGRVDLDDMVSEYLTSNQLNGLKSAGGSTIRQLLNHSSGVYNYIVNPRFQTASLNDLEKVWQPDELLEYARGEEPAFDTGEDVGYSNTNYVLLGMIIEKITGKPFYEVFEERLFQPLGLNNTQFAAPDPVPNRIIRGYVDLYSNLNLINATYFSGWDYYTADGGLISNSADLAKFMLALFEGNILSPESLEEMLSWQIPSKMDSDAFETFYGLGIFRISTEYGPAYIHSGDAIGYFASMVYFPEQQIAISWAVNANYGKIDDLTQTQEVMEKIFRTVLEN
jgi:D-alanyl-D-alanine carboxypeptidase